MILVLVFAVMASATNKRAKKCISLSSAVCASACHAAASDQSVSDDAFGFCVWKCSPTYPWPECISISTEFGYRLSDREGYASKLRNFASEMLDTLHDVLPTSVQDLVERGANSVRRVASSTKHRAGDIVTMVTGSVETTTRCTVIDYPLTPILGVDWWSGDPDPVGTVVVVGKATCFDGHLYRFNTALGPIANAAPKGAALTRTRANFLLPGAGADPTRRSWPLLQVTTTVGPFVSVAGIALDSDGAMVGQCGALLRREKNCPPAFSVLVGTEPLCVAAAVTAAHVRASAIQVPGKVIDLASFEIRKIDGDHISLERDGVHVLGGCPAFVSDTDLVSFGNGRGPRVLVTSIAYLASPSLRAPSAFGSDGTPLWYTQVSAAGLSFRDSGSVVWKHSMDGVCSCTLSGASFPAGLMHFSCPGSGVALSENQPKTTEGTPAPQKTGS